LLLHSYSIIYIIFDSKQKYIKNACERGNITVENGDNYQQFFDHLLAILEDVFG